ncbi:MAG: transglutaminase TgpA family protein [Chthonomonadales bacterium]
MAVQNVEPGRTDDTLAIAAPPSMFLYLAGYAVTACGLLAAALILERPSLAGATLALSGAGFAVSFLLRMWNLAPEAIELPGAALAAVVALAGFLSDQSLQAVPGGIGDRAHGLVVLLVWLSVARSFTLVTDASVLFCCVPTIALTGLAGTMTTEPALTGYFALFVAASVFMLVHENVLRAGRRAPGEGTKPRVSLGLQLEMALMCILGAVLLANLIAPIMSAAGSHLIFTPTVTSGTSQADLQSAAANTTFSERAEVPIGVGPVSLSHEEVLRIRAEHGSYWRGATFDQYTGHGWRNTLGQPSVVMPDTTPPDAAEGADFASPWRRFRLPVSAYETVGSGSHTLRQRVRLINGLFSDVYGAPEMRIVEISQARLVADTVGTVHLVLSLYARPGARGGPMDFSPPGAQLVSNAVYDVVSEVPDQSPDRLRRAPASVPPPIAVHYLAMDGVPPDVAARLRSLALQVTAGMHNTYDKASALTDYVSGQCKYNTGAPAVPSNRDAVGYFLFESRQGYCDLFASALAMLCRAAGIPARVASGFVQGDYDADAGEFVVRESDKHLWTEVYFAGVGWVPFDATADAEDISASNPSAQHRASLWGVLFSRGWLPPLGILAFAAMIAYVLKVEAFDRMRRTRNRVTMLVLPANNLAILQAYLYAERRLARSGLPRPPAMTPWEYLEMLQNRLKGVPGVISAMEELTTLAVEARYAGSDASVEQVGRARAALALLRAELKKDWLLMRKSAAAEAR